MTQPARRHWGAFYFGLALGWAVGLAVGILKAPRSGAQTRQMISSEAERLVGEITLELERNPVQAAIEEGKAAARARQSERGDPPAPSPEEDEPRR